MSDHNAPLPLSGPYAITSETICRSQTSLMIAVKQALDGGARLIQYRDKWNDRSTQEQNARSLLDLCRHQCAQLILNDDVELALTAGADGVHLGASDAPLAEARARLGPMAIIGVTCSNSLQRALDAQAGGASYVAFGRFYDSSTKPHAPSAPLELLAQAKARLHIPICAIGGVTPENAAALIARGADMIAAVEGIFGASDIEAAARRYSRLFPR